MTASLFIAVFLFPIVALLCSVHKYPKGVDTGNQMLNKTQTATLKGIFIIVVFFHHFSQIIEVSNLKSLYNSGGYIAVTVFFLIAGYVTVLELERTKDYKQFLYKKILRLYLPILIFTVTFNNFLTGLLFMYAITLIAYRFMPLEISRTYNYYR